METRQIIDAKLLRRKVVQMHDRIRRDEHSNIASMAELAVLERVQRLIDKMTVVEVVPDYVMNRWQHTNLDSETRYEG